MHRPILLCLLLAAVLPAAEDAEHQLQVRAGYRLLDLNDAAIPSDDLPTIGAEYQVTLPTEMPFFLGVGLLYGYTDGESNIGSYTELEHTEFQVVGGRRVVLEQGLAPYFLAGLSYATLDVRVEDASSGVEVLSEDDSAVGGILGLGMDWQREAFVAGIDLRYTYNRMVLADTDYNGGGLLVSVGVGGRF